MGSHAAEDVGVFILDFALDDFLAEGAAGVVAWFVAYARQFL